MEIDLRQLAEANHPLILSGESEEVIAIAWSQDKSQAEVTASQGVGNLIAEAFYIFAGTKSSFAKIEGSRRLDQRTRMYTEDSVLRIQLDSRFQKDQRTIVAYRQPWRIEFSPYLSPADPRKHRWSLKMIMPTVDVLV